MDCAPSLKSLALNNCLDQHNIFLELGNTKNINKNPVAERANQELELELLKIDPSGNPVSAVTLLKAVCTLNSRIRSNGLSSKEMFTRRDQISGDHLKFTDKVIATKQESAKTANHPHSSKSKAKGAGPAKCSSSSAGDLVYLKEKGSKFEPRQPYMVVNVSGANLLLQKMSPTGLLSSGKVLVPRNKVFHINGELKEKKAIAPVTSSDSDDSDCYSDSSVESDSDIDTHSVELPPPDIAPGSSSRPVRQRRKPDFYGSVRDTDSLSDSVQNDVIDNWYPGWNKERTRRYIDNGQQEL